MKSTLRILFFLTIMFLLSNTAKAADTAIVTSMSPTTGLAGDIVTLICEHVNPKSEVLFDKELASVASVKTLSTGALEIKVTVPAGLGSVPVVVRWDGTQTPAGSFTYRTKAGIPTMPDDPVYGNPIGGRPGTLPPLTGGPGTGPSSLPKVNFDPDLDLPLDAPEFGKKKDDPKAPPKPPEPPGPPPTPTIPPPNIYGKDLVSSNGTIIYVIDISGSMSWDEGQYVKPDGTVATGCRLDRAKAELTKSILTLPKSFKFTIDAYDCSVYIWRTYLADATDANKADAIKWVNELQPQGATGTGPAVSMALHVMQNKLIVLLTDGAPNCGAGDGQGSTDCIAAHKRMIDSNNGHGVVINVFGIGATGEFRQFCMDIACSNGGSYTDVK